MKRDWNNIKKQLLDTNYNKSVLLGNGFTIACGNNNILNSEKIIDNVHKYFRNRATTKKIASIEAYIYEVEKQFIKQIYNILPIDKIKKLPNLENIIEFLNFFDKFYTLNYDHVLYCLLMILHDRGKEIDDGFRKQKNEQLIWNNNVEQQCVYYLHGAFHFVSNSDNRIRKIKSSVGTKLFAQIKKEWNKGEKSHIIIASDYKTKELKMTSEEYSPYLKKCYSAFKNAQDILVTMGVSFSSSDMHIVKAIKSNHNLKKVYIGYYKNKELQNFKKIFNGIDKIEYYNTENIFHSNNQ